MLARVRVPRYLHLPVQILWFDMEDIAIIIVSYTLWLLLDSWMLIWMVVLVPWLFRSMKADKPRGYLRHILYAYGFQKLKRYPPPQTLEFNE